MAAPRKVKTAAGARRYKVPVGSAIPKTPPRAAAPKVKAAAKPRPRKPIVVNGHNLGRARTRIRSTIDAKNRGQQLRARDDEQLFNEARLITRIKGGPKRNAYRTSLARELARRGYDLTDFGRGKDASKTKAHNQYLRRKKAGLAGRNSTRVKARKVAAERAKAVAKRREQAAKKAAKKAAAARRAHSREMDSIRRASRSAGTARVSATVASSGPVSYPQALRSAPVYRKRAVSRAKIGRRTTVRVGSRR